MIDLWSPAIEKIKNKELTGQILTDLVERTKEMEAKKGRASYLGVDLSVILIQVQLPVNSI